MDRSSSHESSIGGLASPPAAAASNNAPHRGNSDASVNTKQSERSAVVLALFGPAVGPCAGDFSTTYFRANGRLYAATHAILFYSNLFGFERRLCLRFSDIESIESYRSTSIKVSMVDCEDHLFRKFVNREQVLQLLNHLHRKAMGTERIAGSLPHLAEAKEVTLDFRPGRSPTPDNHGDSLSIDELYPRERLPSDPSRLDGIPAPSAITRQRSQSMPSMEALEALETSEASNVESQDRTRADSPSKRRRVFRKTFSAITSGRATPPRSNSELPEESSGSDAPVASERLGLSVSHVSSLVAPADFDVQAAWNNAKIPYSEVALNNIILPCSLEAFMDLFFSNDASFPISKYQREAIKDRNIFYAKWKKSSSTFPPQFDRDISFIHPLNNSLGPSEAKTSRQQRFQRFGTLGVTLQNTTNIQGVPGADCFKVEDRWVVESISDDSLRFSVYFQIDFFKRTMIKSLIQKNVKAETKKWFQGYVNFVKRALHEDYDRKGRPLSPIATSHDGMEPENFSDAEERRGSWLPRGTSASVLLAMVLVTLVAQLCYLQRSVLDLQDQLTLMRQDSHELRVMLQHIMAT